MSQVRLAVVILTYNEQDHLERAISSLNSLLCEVLVVDSYSNDRTVEIARACGVRVLQNTFVNHAQQFNWALDQLDPGVTWVLRLDADEVITTELQVELTDLLKKNPSNIDGLAIRRRIVFQGQKINWGGVFPIPVVRLFRLGKGRCETCWMDEHIVIDGAVSGHLLGEIHDVSKHSLSRWVEKHNEYSSREALQTLLNERGSVRSVSGTAKLHGSAKVKRYIKISIFSRLPIGVGPLTYFIYRYILRLGFMDGFKGSAFHFLQAFWYRYLVELKVRLLREAAKTDERDLYEIARTVLELKNIENVGLHSHTKPADGS